MGTAASFAWMSSASFRSAILFGCVCLASLVGCRPGAIGLDAGGESSTSTGELGTESSTSTGTSTGTETGEPGTSDTGTETGEPGTETGETGETLPDTELGWTEALCPSAGWAPDRVVAAVVRRTLDGSRKQIFFLRADGSNVLVLDEPNEYDYVLAGGSDRVLLARQGECGSTSVVSMLDRATGELLWEGVDLPAEVNDARILADGRVVIDGGQCDDPESYFVVLAPDGTVLDSGIGDPVHMMIRDDGLVPLWRSFPNEEEGDNVSFADRHRWRDPLTQEEFWPSLDTAVGRGRFDVDGRLMYGAIIDGAWTFVIEAPGSPPSTFAAPAIAALHDQGWVVSINEPAWRVYGWAVDWAFVRAYDPDNPANARQFALSEVEVVELTDNGPPGLPCLGAGVDRQRRLLRGGVEGGAIRMYRADTPDLWTPFGPLIAGAGDARAFEAEPGTYMIQSDAGSNGCPAPIGPVPDPVLDGEQYVVSRAGHDYVTTNFGVAQWFRKLISYGGHCVGHGFTDTTDLRVHDLELEADVDIVNEQGGARLVWLAEPVQ